MKKRIVLLLLAIFFVSLGVSHTSYAAGDSVDDPIEIEVGKKVTDTMTNSHGNAYFKFTIASAGRLSFTVKSYNEEVIVMLLDGDGFTEIGAAVFVEQSEGTAYFDRDVTKGTYYLYCRKPLSSPTYNGSYEFTITLEKHEGGGSNNSFSSAKSIVLNKTYNGQIANNDMVDYYKFSVSKDGNVSLKCTTYMGTVYFVIYDEDYEEVYDKTVCWDLATHVGKKTINLELEKGKYYLLVKGGSTGPYSFSLEQVVPGWKKVGQKYKYMKSDGTYYKNDEYTINGKVYRFNSLGYMITGWYQSSYSKWYYYKSDGSKAKGWVKIGKYWYYFYGSSGYMETGWNNGYYLDANGRMVTGWKYIDGSWYYFKSSGLVAKGWNKIGGKWYYMYETSGRMYTGMKTYGDSRYYLDPSTGAMTTGWKRINGDWYFFKSSGEANVGWLYQSGKTYYMYSTGRMMTGTHYIDGTRYTFDSNGVLVR